jgi:cysteine synthase A
MNYDKNCVDAIEQVSSDEALITARKIIKEEGIPVGISSGAAIAAGLRRAALSENKDKNIVVIVQSYSERYLSTLLAEQERKMAQELVAENVDEQYLSKVKFQ